MGERPTKTVKASEARQQWSSLLNQVFREEARIVVEKSGIPVAAVISYRDLEFFQEMEAQREEDFKVIDEMRDAFKDVPPEEIEREAAKAIREVREEDRRKRRLADQALSA